jgi:electron transport complex protein RnfB
MSSTKLAPRSLAARINDLLPQTQCTRCGYPDCASYAGAIASGEAGINRCPPGGAEGIQRLASLTGNTVIALHVDSGPEGPRTVALIDEAWCIGCTLCLPVCPTDAIVGSNKRMHTVIATHCTGCELCLPVCPVDCISLVNVSGELTGWSAWTAPQADAARERYALHQIRLAKEPLANAERLEKKAETKLADLAAHSRHTEPSVLDAKRAVIEAALARARARRGEPG